MTDDEAIATARERDEEIARIRAETRQAGETLGIKLDMSPDAIRAMVERHGRRLASQADEEARQWAEERFTLRRSRLEGSRVRLEDAEIVGVAALMPEPIDEPPIDDIHRRRIEATMALRALHGPRLPVFRETPALAGVRAILRARAARKLEQSFLVLYGMIGTSKTSAGAHAIASVAGGRYVDARVLCDLHGSFARDDRALVAKMLDAPILLVDELKSELFANRSLGNVLSDVIDARRGGRRVTIMTTNVKPRELAESLTKQAQSRATGRVNWVKCVGEDLRKRRASGT